MELGDLAEWVTAIVTFLGFVAAVWQLRANLRDSRAAREKADREEESRREAMARAVGVKVSWQPAADGGPPQEHQGLMPADVEVLNAGQYPINGAVLELEADDYPMEVVYGTIFPGEHLKETHRVRRLEVVFAELTGGATLVFTDTYGNHWARSPHDLERRDQPARMC